MARAKAKYDIPEDYISISVFARDIELSRNAIVKACGEGRITSFVRIGKKIFLDPERAKSELKQNTSKIKGGDMRPKMTIKNQEEEDPTELATIHALRRRKLEIENAIKVQELRKLTGLLIEKSAVENRLFQIGQIFRVKMQQLPASIVDSVMSAKTRNAAILVIEAAINDALTSLADEIKSGVS